MVGRVAETVGTPQVGGGMGTKVSQWILTLDTVITQVMNATSAAEAPPQVQVIVH